MTATLIPDKGDKQFDVFLVGNNPAEISDIHNRISSFKNPFFKIAIAFDLQKIFRRIRMSNPVSILLDDRLNKKKLSRLIKRLHRNPKTREIPVTLLKSTNSEFRISGEIDDYVLKDSMTADDLRRAIMNSRRRRRTSIYLYKSYKKSRNFIQKIWLDLKHLF